MCNGLTCILIISFFSSDERNDIFSSFHINSKKALNSIFFYASVYTSMCISVKVEMLVAALLQQVCMRANACVCVCVCMCLSTHSAQCYLNSLALKHSIIGRKLNVLYLPQPASGAVYIARHHQLYHVCSSTFTLQF